jgi:hypothetical protein
VRRLRDSAAIHVDAAGRTVPRPVTIRWAEQSKRWAAR